MRTIASARARRPVLLAAIIWPWLATAAAEYRLDLKTPSVRPGERIAVVHSDFPITDRYAWIAFYENVDARDQDYLHYTFLRNLNNRVFDVIAPRKLGTEYHFRLFKTEGYDCTARSAPVEVTLTPSATAAASPPSPPAPPPPPPTEPIPAPQPPRPPVTTPTAQDGSDQVTITDWLHVDLPPSTQPQTVSHGDDLNVTFPASALGQGGRVSIGRVTELPPDVFGYVNTIGPYEVALEGHRTFTEDVVLEFTFDPAQFDASTPLEDQMIPVRWDVERRLWVELPSAFDPERNVVVARTRQLSKVGVVICIYVGYQAKTTLHRMGVFLMDPLKRLFNHVIITEHFRLYFNPAKLPERGRRETHFEAEYEALWNYKHDAWVPFIRDCAYYLEKSRAAYQTMGLEPNRRWVTFEIGPGRGGRTWGGGVKPGIYDYSVSRAYISSDHSTSSSKLKHALAHELFHAIQHRAFPGDPGKGIDAKGLWWIEATAEYAASSVAWNHRHLHVMGRGDVYPFLLELPLTQSGEPPDSGYPSIEYAKGYFIDFLVASGAAFERMHTDVLAGYVQSGDPLPALEDFLRANGPAPLPALFRKYAAWFLLGNRSPFTPTYTDPLRSVRGERGGKPVVISKDQNDGMAQHTSRLDAPYTANMWAVKADAGTPPEPQTLVIAAEQMSRWALVDLFVLDDETYASDDNPEPVASLIVTNKPVTLTLRPDQTLYAISVNRCNYRKAETSIAVSFGVRVAIQGERNLVLVLEADQTEMTRTFEAIASPPGAYRFEWNFGHGTAHKETKPAGETSSVTHTFRELKPGDKHSLQVGLHSGTGDLLAEDTITLTMAAGDAGFWVLDESERKPPGERPGYTTVKLGEYKYESKVKIKYQDYPPYEAAGWARWDALPKVVPNGADWRMPVQAHFRHSPIQSSTRIFFYPTRNPSAGFSVRTEPGGETTRPQSEDEKRGIFAAFFAGRSRHPAEHSGIPWYTFTRQDKDLEDAVTIPFPLLPPSTGQTAERYTISLHAWVADEGVTEKHSYRWTRELSKELEADFRRETARVNFLGARSWTKNMTAAAQARPVTLDDPATIAEGSTAVLGAIKHLPATPRARQEAAFEVSLENGPDTPTFSWYFGVGPPKQANAWTETAQTRFTYMKPGVYTVRVTVRDKNAYTRGLLAEGAWQITVLPAENE